MSDKPEQIMPEKQTWNWPFYVVLILTIIYCTGAFILYYFDQKPGVHLNETGWNALGDTLAGVFAPVTFVWLVTAVIIQKKELNASRKQFDDLQKVIKEQLEFLEKQNNNAKRDAERSFKVSLFEPRLEIYKQLVALRYRGELDEDRLLEWTNSVEEIGLRCRFLFGRDVTDMTKEAEHYGQMLHKALQFQRTHQPEEDGTFNDESEYASVDALERRIRVSTTMVQNAFTYWGVSRRLLPYLRMHED